jgi:hypothetical protein
MIENALRTFCRSSRETKKVASAESPKPPTKSFRKQLAEALEKNAGLGASLQNFISRVGTTINKPWIGLLTLGGVAGTAGYEYLKGHMAERGSEKQTQRVLAHLKSLYPEDQARVQEAYEAISHVAPSVSQNPLIARSIVSNMMKELSRPDFQVKGYPIVPADINTLNTVSKIEESRSKALAHTGKAPPLLGLIAKRLDEAGAIRKSVADFVPPPPSDIDMAAAQSAKDTADLNRLRIIEKEHYLKKEKIIPT